MVVTDLRLGNIVLGYNKIPFKWDFNHFKLCGDGIDADEIGMPILLTDEWLLRFGFIEKDYEDEELATSYYDYNGFLLDLSFQPTGSLCVDISYELKYVHQLQNLYFILTGKELEIKYGSR